MNFTANPRTRLLGRARLWLVGAVAAATGATVAFAGAAASNQQAHATGTSPDSGSNAGAGTSDDNQDGYGNGQQGGSTGLLPGGTAGSHGSSHSS